MSFHTPSFFIKRHLFHDVTNKKDTILETTIKHIAIFGDSFSTERIAEDVGCSQSLIFRYYHNKKELMRMCFDSVCHDMLAVLKSISFPLEVTPDSINNYILEIWDAYMMYLESNEHKAKTYVFFINRGYRYPTGYPNPNAVVRKIIGDKYDVVTKACPDFTFKSGYIIIMSNLIVSSDFKKWFTDIKELDLKVRNVISHGIVYNK